MTRETAIAHLQRAADLRAQAHDAHGDEREELRAAADEAQATGERQRAILAARLAGAAGRVEERAPVVLSLDEAAQHLPSSARKAPHALKAFFERAHPVSKDDRAIGVALYVNEARPSGKVSVRFALRVLPGHCPSARAPPVPARAPSPCALGLYASCLCSPFCSMWSASI